MNKLVSSGAIGRSPEATIAAHAQKSYIRVRKAACALESESDWLGLKMHETLGRTWTVHAEWHLHVEPRPPVLGKALFLWQFVHKNSQRATAKLQSYAFFRQKHGSTEL